MAVSLATRWGLQERFCCPHCWERYAPERCLWVSTSPALCGDPRLGPEQQARFAPDRFTPDGDALDRRGSPCQDLACPNCHLPVPRSCLEMSPLFLSIFGAPGSGKSVFLGAMSAELRKVLPRDFCLSFADADREMNSQILNNETGLLNLAHGGAKEGEVVPIREKIHKTDENLFTDNVMFDSGDVLFPRPIMFTVQPTRGHTNESKAKVFARSVCLYDNAGESFEPGRDDVKRPHTRHLAQAQALLVVIDLTQDGGFQSEMRRSGCDARSMEVTRQQDGYVHEAARRIRKFARMRETDKLTAPAIVVLTKCDTWWPVLKMKRPNEPWIKPVSHPFCAIDIGTIEEVSERCHATLQRTSPRLTGAIDGVASDVVYMPVSASGWNTTFDPATGKPALIQGSDGQRHWATVPFLYALRRTAPGLITEIRRKKK